MLHREAEGKRVVQFVDCVQCRTFEGTLGGVAGNWQTTTPTRGTRWIAARTTIGCTVASDFESL